MSMSGLASALAISASETGRRRRWPEAMWIESVAASIAATSWSETVLRPVLRKVSPVTSKLSLVNQMCVSSTSAVSRVVSVMSAVDSTGSVGSPRSKGRLCCHIRLNSSCMRKASSG